MALSEDTIDNLEAAKRGQPRRFVLVSKGSKIVNMVVFKKGSFESQTLKAKEEGSGEVSFGVTGGKGANLTFQLAKADGFEAAPTADSFLKKFLSEEAGMKLTPAFVIVETLPKIDDDPPVGGKEQPKTTWGKAEPTVPPRGEGETSPQTTIGTGRVEATKSDFENALKKVKPETDRARRFYKTVDDARVAAGQNDPNAQLTQDLVYFQAQLHDPLNRLDTGAKVVRESIQANNYHAAIRALEILTSAAASINENEPAFYKLLSRHDGPLPPIGDNAPPSTDPVGEKRVEDELNRLKKLVGDALAVDSPSTAIKNAQADLENAFQEAIQARNVRDVEGAEFQLSVVDTRLQGIAPMLEGWKRFDEEYQKHKVALEQAFAIQVIPGSSQDGVQQQLKKEFDEIMIAVGKGDDLGLATARIRILGGKAPTVALEPDRERYVALYGPVSDRLGRITGRLRDKHYGDPPPKSVVALIKAASDINSAIFRDTQKREWTEAIDKIPSFVGAIEDVEDWEAQRARDILVELDNGTKKKDKKKSLSKIKDLAAADPDLLRRISEQPGGKEFLDDMMDVIGDKAGSDRDKAFASKALEARFNVKLNMGWACECGAVTGEENKSKVCDICSEKPMKNDWSTRALPRMYKVMKMVPEKHTRDNDSLKVMTRTKKLEASWYSGDTKAVVLNMPRAGGAIGKLQDIGYNFTMPFKTGKGPAIVKAFDTVALHEIGHAVDDKNSYMDKHQGSSTYGSWRVESAGTVAKVAVEEMGLADSFRTYGRKFLLICAEEVLAGNKLDDSNSKAKNAWGGCIAYAKGMPGKDVVVGLPEWQDIVNLKNQYDLLDPRPKSFGDLDQNQGNEFNRLMNTIRVPGVSDAVREAVPEILFHGMSIAEAVDSVYQKVGEVTDDKAQPDWKALRDHDAMKWLAHVKLKSADSGLWDSDSNTKKYAAGGRVYQQAYSSQWYSYDLGARNSLVSSYQFRAPGEWFAECYAAYFVGKLPARHPIARWLKKEETGAN